MKTPDLQTQPLSFDTSKLPDDFSFDSYKPEQTPASTSPSLSSSSFDASTLPDDFSFDTYGQPPKPPEQPSWISGAMDYAGDTGNWMMSVMAGTGERVGYLLERFSPLHDAGKALRERSNESAQWWADRTSEEFRKQAEANLIERDENGGWKIGDNATITTLVANALGSLPEMMLTAGAAKAAALAGRAAIAVGMPETIAAATAGNERARRILKYADIVTGATAGGASEGALAAGASGALIEDFTMQKSHDELMQQSDRYRQIYNSAEGAEETERRDYAKATLAIEAGRSAAVNVGMATALLGAPMGAFFGSLGKKGIGGAVAGEAERQSLVKTAAKGAGYEAAQEFAQSGSQTLLQNLGIREFVDPKQNVWEGVLNDAITGGLIGGMLGATVSPILESTAPKGSGKPQDRGGAGAGSAPAQGGSGVSAQAAAQTDAYIQTIRDNGTDPIEVQKVLRWAKVLAGGRTHAEFNAALRTLAETGKAPEVVEKQTGTDFGPDGRLTEAALKKDSKQFDYAVAATFATATDEDREAVHQALEAQDATGYNTEAGVVVPTTTPSEEHLRVLAQNVSASTNVAHTIQENAHVASTTAQTKGSGSAAAGNAEVDRAAAPGAVGTGTARSVAPVQPGEVAETVKDAAHPLRAARDFTPRAAPVAAALDAAGVPAAAAEVKRDGTVVVAPDATPEAADAAIDAAANDAATSESNEFRTPSDKEIEEGNYRKGRVLLARDPARAGSGFKVVVENVRGGFRQSKPGAAKRWRSKLREHYGYLAGTRSSDGEPVDAFILKGANDTSKPVFVIHQIDQQTGEFDENKVVFGATTEEEATAAYAANYPKGWKVGAITRLTQEQAHAWAQSGETDVPPHPISKTPMASLRKTVVVPVPRGVGSTAAQTVATQYNGTVSDFGRRIEVEGRHQRDARVALRRLEKGNAEAPRDTEGAVRDARARQGNAYSGAAQEAGGTDRVGYRDVDGGSAGADRGVRRLEPTEELSRAFNPRGLPTPGINELTSEQAERFVAAIENAKSANRFGAAVYVYPRDEYASMRMFLSEDGNSGFALKGDDIVSVFSHGGGSVHALLQLAIQEGGRRLDCFDTVLPYIYATHGFRAISRLRWDDSQAPPEWDKSLFQAFNGGEPDVVFMAYDPSYFGRYRTSDGAVYSDYDAALAAQKDAVVDETPRASLGRGGTNPESEISGRLPTAVKVVENPLSTMLLSDADAIMRMKQAKLDKLADLLSQYREFVRPDDSDAKTAINAFVEHVASNLRFVMRQLSPKFIRENRRWYDGAHKIATKFAEKYGMETRQAAAVIAAMSPQNEWENNVSLAERVIRIWHEEQDTAWTPEMDKIARTIYKSKEQKRLLRLVRNRTLGELQDDAERATWVRAFSQAHDDPRLQSLNAEGEDQGFRRNKVSGAFSRATWKDGRSVASAISVMRDGSIENISEEMGENNKVRNFYNNIANPDSEYGHVTIDTHAVGAGLLSPFAANGYGPSHAFGKQAGKGTAGPPGDAALGVTGPYGLYQQAYAQVASEFGLKPRELQSITWVAVKQRFDNFKRGKGRVIHNIWEQYSNGTLSLDDARSQIWALTEPARVGGQAARAAAPNDAGVVPRAGVRGSQRKAVARAGTDAAADVPRASLKRDDITQTSAFKRWFGDSKVVDAEGKPLVVYHGTPTPGFDRFKIGRGGWSGGFGVWFGSDPGIANEFAQKRYADQGPAVYPVYLSIHNPKEYTDWSEFTAAARATGKRDIGEMQRSLRNSLIRRGHDGVVIRGSDTDRGGVRDDWVAFRPEQIKSATGNQGTFDPSNPDIRYSLRRSDSWYYSALVRSLEDAKGSPKSAPAKTWSQWLDGAQRRGEFRKTERDWMGLDDWLAQQDGNVSREQIAAYAAAHTVELEESKFGAIDTHLAEISEAARDAEWFLWEKLDHQVNPDEPASARKGAEKIRSFIRNGEQRDEETDRMRSIYPEERKEYEAWADALDERAEQVQAHRDAGFSGPTKYGDYVLPGGENYRELLLRMPVARPNQPGAALLAARDELAPRLDINSRDSLEGFASQLQYIAAVRERNPYRVHDRGPHAQLRWQGINGQGAQAFGPSSDKAEIERMVARFNDTDQLREAASQALQWADTLENKGEGEFRSGHWDQPNILVHVRFNERTDAEGKRVLFIEEIQSDWHQHGRRYGYKTDVSESKRLALIQEHTEAVREMSDLMNEAAGRSSALNLALRRSGYGVFETAIRMGAVSPTIQDEIGKETMAKLEAAVDRVDKADDALKATEGKGKQVPNAPLKNADQWSMLAFKRMVRFAAENGFERIAWTTGDQQNKRYSLGDTVSNIVVWGEGSNETEGHHKFVEVQLITGKTVGFGVDEKGVVSSDNEAINGRDLDEVIGKDAANRVMEIKDEYADLDVSNLTFGGKGMRGFYDEIVPFAVNAWAKRFGGKIGSTSIDTRNHQLPNSNADLSRAVAVENFGAWTVKVDGVSIDTFETKDEAERYIATRGFPKNHSLDVTPSMRDAALSGLPLFSISDKIGAGMKQADVEAHVNKLIGNWRDATPTHVVQGIADLPQRYLAWANNATAGGATLEAFYADGTVYVVADHVTSLADVERAIVEEQLGHNGLARAFGSAEFNALLDDIHESIKNRHEYAELADLYKHAYANQGEKGFRRRVTEEYIAKFPDQQPTVWEMLKGFVRNFLRKHGFVREWTDADIKNLMNIVHEGVKSGRIYGGLPKMVSPNETINGDGSAVSTYKGRAGEGTITHLDGSRIVALDSAGLRATVSSTYTDAPTLAVTDYTYTPESYAALQRFAQEEGVRRLMFEPGVIPNASEKLDGIDIANVGERKDSGAFSLRNRATTDQRTEAILERALKPSDAHLTWWGRTQQAFREIGQHFADGDTWLSMKVGWIDSAAAIEKLERMRNADAGLGKVLDDASQSAYKFISLTRNLPKVVAAVFRNGVPRYQGGSFVRVQGRRGLEEIFRPLYDTVDGKNLIYLWEGYALARRSAQLINQQNLDGTSKEKLLSQDEIDQLLQLGNEHPQFVRVFDEWQQFNHQLIDLAVDRGAMDSEEAELWKQNDYVPFYRVLDEGDEDVGGGARRKKGLSGQKVFSQRLTGSDKRVQPIMENILMNTAAMLDKVYKNEAMNRIVALADGVAMQKVPLKTEAIRLTNGELADALYKGGFFVGQRESQRARQVNRALWASNFDEEAAAGRALALRMVEAMTDEQRDRWQTVFRRVKPKGKDIVSVMQSGQETFFQVTDPLVMRAIADMNEMDWSWLAIPSFAKNMLTTMVTMDPGFMVANWMRDTIAAFVTSGENFTPMVSALKDARDVWQHRGLSEDLAVAGGATAGFYNVMDDFHKVMQRNGTIVMRGARKLWESYRKIGMVSEQVNRMAIARAVLERGGSVSEAAYQAQDILNFSQRGDAKAMQLLIRTVPFLNARVQGLYRLLKGAAGADSATPERARVHFAIKGLGVMLASMLLALKNWGDDDYEKVPDDQKDNYWHLFIGPPGKRQHYALPKPFEIGVFFATLPERLVRLIGGQDHGKEMIGSLARATESTLAFNPIPQFAKPALENWTNYDFFTGKPVVDQNLADLPADQQYNPYTSPLARAVGGALPEFLPDSVRSPVKLEHAVRGYFGTLGGYLLQMGDAAARIAGGFPVAPDSKLTGVPIMDAPLRRFVRGDPETESRNKYQDDLYEALGEADSIYRGINALQAQGQLEAAQALVERKTPYLEMRQSLHAAETQLRAINQATREIMNDTSRTAEEKRQEIDDLTRQKNEMLRQVAPMLGLLD